MVRSRDGYKGGNPGGYSGGNSGPSPGGSTSGSLEQRLDRWVSAGRQLVDGVAGARPGSRPPGRAAGLGRWVEERMDWLLDDGDDWREPWQDSPPSRWSAPSAQTPAQAQASDPAPPPRPAAPANGRRRSLEAVSRRGAAAADTPASTSAKSPAGSAAGEAEWPDDDSFSIPRWRRPAPAAPLPPDLTALRPPSPPSAPPSRPLPRSTRRRP